MPALNIDEINALANVGGYTQNIELSQKTAAFLIAAVFYFQQSSQWTSNSGTLDEGMIDEIDALIANAQNELSRKVDNVITGSIQLWIGVNIPAGWLECNGDTVNQDDYPELYETLTGNVPQGGAFQLPDFEGKVARGVEGAQSAGQSYGNDNVTLGIGNIPSHSHGIDDPNYVLYSTNAGANFFYGATGITPSSTGSTGGATGGALPFSVVGRHIAVRYIIKA